VHSIDRAKIATRLSAQRPAALPPLNVCIQVNVSNERTKAGVSPAGLDALVQSVRSLPHLRLRGLMAIPRPQTTFDEQRASFLPLVEAMSRLRGNGVPLDTLSMGMSADLEAAIAAGATMVRIGTAIFGPRR